MSAVDATIVSTALPTISDELGDEALRSWVITSYLLATVATMPLYGKIGDLYGRKRVFLVAVAIFAIGSMLSGAAGSMEQLLVFRAIQGMGSGGIGALSMAIVADIVPARQLGRWLGYQGAVYAAASLVGPLAGGLFVDNLTWRWAFYVNLPFALLSLLIVWSALHVPYERIPHALDYPGAALITSALACLVVVASVGSDSNDWTSPVVIGVAIAAVVLGALFVWWERRAPEPVLPLRLLGVRVVRVASGINLTAGASFAAGIYFIPVFVQQVAGYSPTTSGFLLVPFMFTTAFATLIAGRAVERTGHYRIWPIVGSIIAVVGTVLLATLGLDTPVWLVAVFGSVLGIGIGFVMQTSLLAVQNGAEQRDLGVATSTALLSRMLGSTLGVALCSAALQSQLPSGRLGAVDYADALPYVYYAALPVALALVVLALRLPQLRLREDARYDFEPPTDAPVLPPS